MVKHPNIVLVMTVVTMIIGEITYLDHVVTGLITQLGHASITHAGGTGSMEDSTYQVKQLLLHLVLYLMWYKATVQILFPNNGQFKLNS